MIPTPTEERLIDTHNAEACIPYVLGYLEGLSRSGVLKQDLLQFETGFSNARKDIQNGVVALWDLDTSRHIEMLIHYGNLPLKRKPRPGS